MYKEKVNTPEDVKQYYEDWTDRYIEAAGINFQSYRTTNLADMFDYLISAIGIKENQSVLEAGCGVGGSLFPLAQRVNANFTGITISPYQVQKANEILQQKRNTLKGTINFIEADFHNLGSIFPEESLDHVIFFECSGHSNNPTKMIEEVYRVLKEGGVLYIKDSFRKISNNGEVQKRIDETINNFNTIYFYNMLELSELLDIIRRAGFEISFLAPPQYKSDPSIKKEFIRRNNITGLGYGAVDEYEIKCIKTPKIYTPK